MLNWVLQHRVELTLIAWIGNILLCLPFIYMGFSSWLYRKKFRRQLRISAVVQARYAVLDSWLRAGGSSFKDPLSAEVERSLLNDYRQQASKNGAEYYELYRTSEADAHRDLRAVIKSIKEAYHEQENRKS